MKTVLASIAVATAALSFTAGTYTVGGDSTSAAGPRHPLTTSGGRSIPPAELTPVVKRYCGACHNAKVMKGNLSLDDYAVEAAPSQLDVSELMIRKMRADIMPPPGARRPGGDTLELLVEGLENVIDKAATTRNPGSRGFQRLNRPEYERVVHDLLGVDFNAGDYLPLDTKSANFDNIADAQALSPTMLDGYLNAAGAVARIAVGDRHAQSTITTFRSSPYMSQHPWDHLDGTPYGTRGGIVAEYNFPADGYYLFRMNVKAGVGVAFQDVDVTVNDQQVAVLHYEKGIQSVNLSADPSQTADVFRTQPVLVKAGQHRVTASFVKHEEGPY